jgi:hypothetical protein
VVVPLADGWSRAYLEAEDGSRWARPLRRGDVECTTARADDGVSRCLPVAAGSLGGFDADCTTRVADGARSSCSADNVLVRTSAGCPAGITVHRASRRLDAEQVRVNGTCRPAFPDPYREAYAVGDALPASDFPQVTLGNLDGPGRLKRQAVSTSGGTYGIGSFWDSTLGMRCGPALAPDGTHRCFPSLVLVTSPVFADPQCTRQVTLPDPCEFAVIGNSIPDACPQWYRLFLVGTVTAVANVYLLAADGRCVSAQQPQPPSQVFHSLKEVTLDELATLSAP